MESIKKKFLSVLWVPLIVEWIVVIAILVASFRVSASDPYEHPVEPWLDDLSVQYPHVKNETVPGGLLLLLTFWIPLIILIVVGVLKRSILDVHNGVLGFLAGYFLVDLFTNFVKIKVGRFRPDFLDRCQYDAIQGVCTGDPELVAEGRRSFPSGHSSGSFYGCTFIALFLAGKLRTFVMDDYSTRNLNCVYTTLSSLRFVRLCITVAPLFLSTFIAVSRWEDHWHHPSDIIAGSLLGLIGSIVAYLVWWPSPFFTSNFELMDSPRMLYVSKSLYEQANTSESEHTQLISSSDPDNNV